MSSKRRPVSANFKKDGEKGTSQRSRPSTARSTASRQSLNASFVSTLNIFYVIINKYIFLAILLTGHCEFAVT